MTFVDRKGAVIFIGKNARMLVDVTTARELAQACGVAFDALLNIDPDLVQESSKAKKAWAVEPGGYGKALVQVSDLGADLCRFMDLYANRDHAKASPHATQGRQANYVGKRAALRLARVFGGEPWVRDLLAEVPEIRTAGVAHRVKGKDGQDILGPGGKPLMRGADSLLQERPYKIS